MGNSVHYCYRIVVIYFGLCQFEIGTQIIICIKKIYCVLILGRVMFKIYNAVFFIIIVTICINMNFID